MDLCIRFGKIISKVCEGFNSGGGITFVAWLAADVEVGFAVARLVAVLVVACPHALGPAVPLVASISTTKAAQNGFLVRSRLALETARIVDTVLFNKTGTLTKGEYGLTEIIQNSKLAIDGDEIVRLAAAVDSQSEHPVARAIARAARERRIASRKSKIFHGSPAGERRVQLTEGKFLSAEKRLCATRLPRFPKK